MAELVDEILDRLDKEIYMGLTEFPKENIYNTVKEMYLRYANWVLDSDYCCLSTLVYMGYKKSITSEPEYIEEYYYNQISGCKVSILGNLPRCDFSLVSDLFKRNILEIIFLERDQEKIEYLLNYFKTTNIKSAIE